MVPPLLEATVLPGTATAAVPARSQDALAHERRAALTAIAPFVVAFAPFAISIGAAAAALGGAAGWAGTGVIYGGSAQLAVIGMLATAAPLPLTILTGVMINLRLLVFSASIAPEWRGEPLRRKALAAALLVDPTWIVATRRSAAGGPVAARRNHYWIAGSTMWVSWFALVTIGVLLGNRFGTSLVLSMAAPLCLVGTVVPQARTRPGLASAVMAAGVTVIAAGWPSGTGLVVGICAGVAAGAATQRWSQ